MDGLDIGPDDNPPSERPDNHVADGNGHGRWREIDASLTYNVRALRVSARTIITFLFQRLPDIDVADTDLLRSNPSPTRDRARSSRERERVTVDLNNVLAVRSFLSKK